jgi:hypothetical protein
MIEMASLPKKDDNGRKPPKQAKVQSKAPTGMPKGKVKKLGRGR